jgi:hypothetical protein
MQPLLSPLVMFSFDLKANVFRQAPKQDPFGALTNRVVGQDAGLIVENEPAHLPALDYVRPLGNGAFECVHLSLSLSISIYQ